MRRASGHSPPDFYTRGVPGLRRGSAQPCPHVRARATLMGFTPFAALLLPAGHRNVFRREHPTCRFLEVRLDIFDRGIGRRIQMQVLVATGRGTSTAAPGFFPPGSPRRLQRPKLPWALPLPGFRTSLDAPGRVSTHCQRRRLLVSASGPIRPGTSACIIGVVAISPVNPGLPACPGGVLGSQRLVAPAAR